MICYVCGSEFPRPALGADFVAGEMQRFRVLIVAPG